MAKASLDRNIAEAFAAVCGSIATFGPGCIVEASRGSAVTLCESFFCAANGLCRPIPEKQKWEWPETLPERYSQLPNNPLLY